MAEERLEKFESRRNRSWTVRLWVLDGTPMKCYQHGCLSKAGRRMMSADMQMWKWGCLSPRQRASGNRESWNYNVVFPMEETPTWLDLDIFFLLSSFNNWHVLPTLSFYFVCLIGWFGFGFVGGGFHFILLQWYKIERNNLWAEGVIQKTICMPTPNSPSLFPLYWKRKYENGKSVHLEWTIL